MRNDGSPDVTHGRQVPARLMSSACAGMLVFGIVMAILGAILPTLFDTISFDKAQAGNLFLFMNAGMLVPLVSCTMIVILQLIITGWSRLRPDRATGR